MLINLLLSAILHVHVCHVRKILEELSNTDATVKNSDALSAAAVATLQAQQQVCVLYLCSDGQHVRTYVQ